MIDFLTYLFETSLCLAGFAIVYQLFLRRMRHFGWNRAILLVALAASLVLPAVEWEVDRELLPLAEYAHAEKAPVTVVETPPLALGPILETEPVFVPEAEPLPAINWVAEPVSNSSDNYRTRSLSGWNWQTVLLSIWFLGALVAFIRFGLRLTKLWAYRRLPADGDVVALPGGSGSFSFAGRIFIDDTGLSPSERQMVIRHERTHLRLGHFLDNLFLELTAIFWWFHPLVSVVRKNLRAVHEFQADAVAASPDPLQYSQLVLKLARGRIHSPPATAFASSKAGQRIEMLHRKPESKMTRFKYLLILPLLAVLAFSFVLVPAGESSAESAIGQPESRLDPIAIGFAGEAIPGDVPHVQARLEKEVKRLRSDAKLREKLRKRQETWESTITTILEEEGIPTDFFYLAMAESHLVLNIESSAGACGMWQFMPATARKFGLTVNDNLDQRNDALLATRAACRYLKSAHQELGSWTAAAVAYNKGVPGYRNYLSKRNAKSYFEVQDERENYLYRVVAYKMVMTHPKDTGSDLRGEAVDMEPVSNPPQICPLRISNPKVTSAFGMRPDPLGKGRKMHTGTDFKAPRGAYVQAPANGEVIEVGDDKKRGKFVVLRHDDVYTTRYFHLDAVLVPVGQVLRIGKEIGKVGDTGIAKGVHLHYEVIKNGKHVDPQGYMGDGMGAIDGIIDRLESNNPNRRQNGVSQLGDGC